MMYGLYLSAAGAAVQDYRMDVISNNLANVDTIGFKRDMALFVERSAEARQDPRKRNLASPLEDAIGGGLFLARTHTLQEPGALDQTGKPLDLALSGDGFFAVRSPSGALRFTRAGNFTVNSAGELVTSDGKSRVLDTGFSPLIVDSPQGLAVDAEGTVSRNGEVIGQIAIRDFGAESALRKVGDNLFAARDGDRGRLSAAPGLQQGFLEGSASGTRMMRELVELIDASRTFEMNLQALRVQDEALGRTVTRVGAVG